MDYSKLRQKTLNPVRPFDFSQASLQDYRDCRRRFQLRYLEQRHWPAPQAEPIRENEIAIRRGVRFHRLAQQALLGVPAELLASAAQADPDPMLAAWWDAFAALLPSLQDGRRSVETLLAAPLGAQLGNHRLLAKYDLIQIFEDGRAVIYDWKTSPHRPRRANLQERPQTKVYPFLLTFAGAGLNGGKPILPEQIEMTYWFAAHPAQPETFHYSAAHLTRDRDEIQDLVKEIAALGEKDFDKTDDEKRCRFCVYRSLCARGVEAGSMDEIDAPEEAEGEIEIDFDQISEIGF